MLNIVKYFKHLSLCKNYCVLWVNHIWMVMNCSSCKLESKISCPYHNRLDFILSDPDRRMMKRRAQWCQIPTSCGITSRETPLRARNNHEEQCPPKKSHCRSGMYCLGRSLLPTIVVQQEEMTSYFLIFGEEHSHCSSLHAQMNHDELHFRWWSHPWLFIDGLLL